MKARTKLLIGIGVIAVAGAGAKVYKEYRDREAKKEELENKKLRDAEELEENLKDIEEMYK